MAKGLPECYTKSISERVAGKGFTAIDNWDPHPAVGISALFYVPGAVAHLSYGLCAMRARSLAQMDIGTGFHTVCYLIIAALYTCVVPACALADFVYIRRGHRSWWGKVDIRTATVTFLTSVVTFWLRGNSVAETLFFIVVSIGSYVLSGCSKTPLQWVVRHSIWHAVGGSIATYGATRRPPEEASVLESGCLPGMVTWSGASYAGAFGALLAVIMALPAEVRTDLWERGAKLADWKRPVVKD
jgi:hypothetical protein